ncbi:L,D-transpeptidase family protein [Brachybacterium huguangmaarense]
MQLDASGDPFPARQPHSAVRKEHLVNPLARRTLILGLPTLTAASLLGSGTALADPALRSGARGRAVTDVQNRLTQLGYFCGNSDGRFGSLMKQAVYALQASAGLRQTGTVDDATRVALNNGVRPTSRVADGLEIDLGRQIIMFSRGGSVTMILHTSTGSGKRYGKGKIARTPRGDFRVFRTYSKGWQTAPLGRLYRPAYFTGGYAVHGSTSIPNYPASHGCARVSTAAMDRIWGEGWTRSGTRVVVS